MKTISFQDNIILDVMKNREETQREIEEQIKKVEEEDKKLGKLGLKMQKLKDKIEPLMNKYEKAWREIGELGEFDVVSKLSLKNSMLEVEVIDQVELYKETLRKKKYEQSQVPNAPKDDVGGEKEDSGHKADDTGSTRSSNSKETKKAN